MAEDVPGVRRAGREGRDGDQLQLHLQQHRRCAPAQLAKRLEGFARRTRMDIDGLGREVAIQLVDSGLVKSVPDLYRLTKEQLLKLEKFARQEGAEPARRHRGEQGPRPGAAARRRSRSTWSARSMAEVLAEEFPTSTRIVAAKPDELREGEGLRPGAGEVRPRVLRQRRGQEAGRGAEGNWASRRRTTRRRSRPAGCRWRARRSSSPGRW